MCSSALISKYVSFPTKEVFTLFLFCSFYHTYILHMFILYLGSQCGFESFIVQVVQL